MTEPSRIRVSIVGVIVAVLFSALVARLWFLQTGADTKQVAIELDRKSERDVFYESPRGWIYDRHGEVIVQNKTVWVIKIDRRLTDDKLDDTIGRLGKLLGKRRADIVARLDDPRISPLEDALIAVDISDAIRTEISEHREDYPYIQVEQAAVREYPMNTTLAPVLGYVSRITTEDLDRHPQGYGPRDMIGRGGIEAAVEADLRGERSYERLAINPAGEIIGDPLESLPGRKGSDVYLTIDLGLQRQVESSLAAGMQVARRTQNQDLARCCLVNFRAKSAAAVVMDVTTGEILAMASLPSFDPNEFVNGVSERRWIELQEKGGDPLFNRATKGGLAPGSTFKLITSIAGATSGVRNPEAGEADLGCYRNVTGDASQRFCNPGEQRTNGGNPMDMSRALAVSSDTYYYEIGDLLWGIWKDADRRAGDAIQNAARDFGFGEKTGIEIGESPNRVPDAKWRFEYTHARAAAGVEPYASNVNDWDDWNPADNINLAVGQGDLTASPLQLVGAYAAFANGGNLRRPYLVRDVRDHRGRVLRSTEPSTRRVINVPANVQVAVSNGLLGAVSSGTAQRAFAGFDLARVPVMGKTGTAQRTKYPGCASEAVPGELPHTPEDVQDCLGDTSWFVGLAPANAPKYALVVMVEEGGFGGDIAAPIARQIFERLFEMAITPIPEPEGESR